MRVCRLAYPFLFIIAHLIFIIIDISNVLLIEIKKACNVI